MHSKDTEDVLPIQYTSINGTSRNISDFSSLVYGSFKSTIFQENDCRHSIDILDVVPEEEIIKDKLVEKIYNVELNILMDFFHGECLLLLNSLLNPILYALWYKDFRQFILNMCNKSRCFKGSKNEIK